jgi:MFS transporter, FSR family, fosmidomycin resistance protein
MTKSTKTLISLALAHTLLECFSGVWPIYKHLAQLDLTTAGLLMAITSFSASMLQPVFGHYADRGYARAMVVGGTALTGLMMLLGPIGMLMPVYGPVLTYTLFAILMMAARMGHSMFHPAGACLASEAIVGRRSAGLGAFVALGWIGVGCSQFVFSLAYLNADGHSELLLLPGALLMLWILIWCKPLPTAGESRPRVSLRRKFSETWSVRREVGVLFLILLMTSASGAALMFMFPELLEHMGYSGWVLNGGAMAFMLGGTAFGVMVGGIIADRVGMHRAMIVSLAVCCVAFNGFLLLPHLSDTAFLFVCLVTGILIGACQPLPIALSQSVMPENASMISGIIMGWTWAFAGLAPLVVASMVTRFHFSIPGALSVMGLLNVLAVACAICVPLRKRAPVTIQPVTINEPVGSEA